MIRKIDESSLRARREIADEVRRTKNSSPARTVSNASPSSVSMRRIVPEITLPAEMPLGRSVATRMSSALTRIWNFGFAGRGR